MLTIKKPSARSIIERNVAFAVGAGVVPIPILDLGALVTIQIKMVQALAREYKIEPDQRKLRKVIASLLKSPGISTWFAGGVGSLLKFAPGVGGLIGAGTLGAILGGLTYATGRVFALHFEKGGTLEDFSIKAQTKIFRKEFNSGKKLAKSIREKSGDVEKSPYDALNIYLILKPKLGANGKVYLKTYFRGKRPEKYIGTMKALQERYECEDLTTKEDKIIAEHREIFVSYVKEKYPELATLQEAVAGA